MNNFTWNNLLIPNNTAIGYSSLFNNTTGYYNTAIGYSAFSTLRRSDIRKQKIKNILFEIIKIN